MLVHLLQGAWGSHWPLVNAPGSMAERLGRQEFERKRLEDAAEWVLHVDMSLACQLDPMAAQ